MTIPEFTATKGPKSATFRVKNIDHRIDGDFDRIILYPELKTQFGFEPERLSLTWIGASDGIMFAETMRELVTRIKALGPNEAKLKMVI